MLTMTGQPRLVTTGQAARALGIDPSTLARWVHAEKITPTEKTLAGHYRWDLDDLRRQIREQQEADKN